MTTIGRYQVVKELGRGGQGAVYEAVTLGPGRSRRVALKVLSDGATLAREARLGGLLRHPNLVDVYEVGEADGAWFCAMELCADGTLAEAAPLPPRAVVEVGLQVCAALQYAHEELGLVHLDLKPANLLRSGAVVKVADLGIARARGHEEAHPAGTPGFMPPEQAQGGAVDARSDIYALGVTLHVLASGVEVRAADTFAIDAAEVQPAATDLPWLAAVLERCVDPDPAGRFSSMAEVAAALRALVVPEPGLAEALGVIAGPEREDAFVGRAAELEALAALRPGVTTLKGPPGVGKSRLARRAAVGAVWCDLSAARSPADLVQAVAAALGVPLLGKDDEAQVGRALEGEALVVLDGFEGVRDGASLLGRWALRAPALRWLVTSREPAHVDGERILEVGPLSEPDAVALICARASERGLDLAPEGPVVELARRLDGVPLALELAAGRLGVLSVGEVLERLSLSLLRGGRTDRHGTLRAALEWSWEALPTADRAALAALSVFVGPFDAAGAEAVAPGVAPAALVERSLLSPREGRWVLLAPVRAYADEQLVDRVGAEARHGAWFARLGSEAALAAVDHGDGRDGIAAVDEVVAACRRAVARGDAAVAVPTFFAADAALGLLGPPGLAVDLAEAVLALGDVSEVDRAAVGAAAARACLRSRGRAAAEGFLGVAERLAREGGDRRVLARVLQLRGEAARMAGHPERAAADGAEMLALAEAGRDARIEHDAEHLLGSVALDRGQHDEALARYSRSLALAEALGLPGRAATLHVGMAVLERIRGRSLVGIPHLEVALRIAGELGDRALQAKLHHELGQALEGEAARAHLGAAWALARRLGDRRLDAQVGRTLAVGARRAGNLAEAGERYQAALAAARELGDARLESLILGNYAGLRQAERRADWVAHMERAIALLPEGDRVSRAHQTAQRALMFKEEGRDAEALADLRRALELGAGELAELRDWVAPLIASIEARR